MEYYTEIENIIKKIEINSKARIYEENNEKLLGYWNIGKLLIEAQGGKEKAGYGNKLIKDWSMRYTKKYGKGYNYTNLNRFRQLYLTFPIIATVSQLSWSILVDLLPIKDKNKRNYFINLCIEKKLSVRELRKELKSNSYERLLEKPTNIEIITPKEILTIRSKTKNPIIIEIKNNTQINNESDLEIAILSQLSFFFSQIGDGFALIDNQYKINYNNKNYYIDILLFNYKLNLFVVVELKTRPLKKEDKAQVEFYMDLVNMFVKEPFHNKTAGVIITKEQDKLIANFVGDNNIIPLTYELKV